MLKVNKDKLKGYVLGTVVTAILMSMGSTLATGKLTSINVVQGGIKLFVDGKLIKPTDDEGNIVDPLIYNGTTYLPLRALSNALTNYQKL